jgi:hypothetical protein
MCGFRRHSLPSAIATAGYVRVWRRDNRGRNAILPVEMLGRPRVSDDGSPKWSAWFCAKAPRIHFHKRSIGLRTPSPPRFRTWV